MTTLKGLFDAKPRSNRNFLLENKRIIKDKSTSNSLKQKVASDLSQRQRASVKTHSTDDKQSIHRSHSTEKSTETNLKQSFKDPLRQRLNSAFSQQLQIEPVKKLDGLSAKPRSEVSKKMLNSARTGHYLDQENVPFEWTEVCPSLVSHNICHQGVQTDDLKGENFDDQLKNQETEDTVSMEKDKGRLFESVKLNGVNDTANCHSRRNLIEQDLSINGAKNFSLSSGKLHSSGTPKTVASGNLSSRKVHEELEMIPPSYQKGVVPKYLSKRKAEQAIASARSKEIDQNCPEGHLAMPDMERRETLDMILKNYNELITELNKIPVRTDTLKMKQRKLEIERQLDKLEEGIRIFSRSKVYVKLDA